MIGPTFHFDVPRLDFGLISYGISNLIRDCYCIVLFVNKIVN